MPTGPKAAAALARLLELSYPPATLTLPVSRALGHKLAAAVSARTPIPARPFAVCDGLAVRGEDVWPRRRGPRGSEPGGREPFPAAAEIEPADAAAVQAPADFAAAEPEGATDEALSTHTNGAVFPTDLIEVHGDTPGPDEQFAAAQSVVDLPEDAPSTFELESGPQIEAHFEAAAALNAETEALGIVESEAGGTERESSPAGTFDSGNAVSQAEEDEDANAAQTDGTVRLTLRPLQSGRREDALAPGFAVAVPAGAEIPRGTDFIIPLEQIAGPPASLEPQIPEGFVRAAEPARAPMERRRREPRGRAAETAAVEEPEVIEEDLPGAAPSRDWDLFARYQTGSVDVPLYTSRPPQNYVPAGSWARAREELLPERTLLRSADITMLEVLGIEEVDVYRKPVVGIASLGLPMPVAQRRSEARQNQQMMVTGGGPPRRGEEETWMVRVCPLTTLLLGLCRTAQIAALPLGFAPNAYRPLAHAVTRWLSQVDVLLLIGGPHSGPRCLAQDVIAAQGSLALAGMDLEPAGGLSAGLVEGRPVISIPGGLADVAVGFTIFARTVIHKYNPPLGYNPEIPLALENGSQLRPDRDRAVPVRYGYSQQYGMQATRYSGQRGRDPWLDLSRGQAFIVLEAGREYSDGEVVRGFPF